MWGIWLILLVIFAAALPAILIGLMAFASPLIAVIIFVLVGGAALAVAAFRRSAEYVERSEGDPGRVQSAPRSGGAPASGEGGPSATGAR